MAESSSWSEEYDVVVAGGGGAGLMAAVEASERGSKVLLVEKQTDVGAGATGASIVSITAAGTALQAAAGIRDDADAHYSDLLKLVELSGGHVQDYDMDLSRLMVDVAPQAIARLTELGVEFSDPHPEPPHTVYRMHNVVPDSGAFIDVLKRAAIERGVTIRTETVIHQSEPDGAGPVSIAVLRHVRRRQTQAIRVRRAVVLAAGDFSANDDLARTHGLTPEISAVDPLQPNATGDCILLATAIGAATVGLDRGGSAYFRTILTPYSAPDRGLFQEGAILVNIAGRRFANELERPQLAANLQPRKIAFLVFDSRLEKRIATIEDDSTTSLDGWYRKEKLVLSTFPGVAYAYTDDYRNRTDYFFEADSLQALADKLQVPAADFADEIRSYNRAIESGSEDRFGRGMARRTVSEPPFYAVGPIKPFINFSEGGLKVDREMHVIDESGHVIPRLYACGANGQAGVEPGWTRASPSVGIWHMADRRPECGRGKHGQITWPVMPLTRTGGEAQPAGDGPGKAPTPGHGAAASTSFCLHDRSGIHRQILHAGASGIANGIGNRRRWRDDFGLANASDTEGMPAEAKNIVWRS